jgi:Zn-dependent peptidase ImmA (M78 family)/transcriptional regulator with XRE-family HTH domain
MTKPRGVPVSAERLKDAMLLEHKTARELATETNLSEETIGRYVRGESTPQATTLRVIAAALSRPEAYFLKPVHDLGGSALFWRSLSAATKTARLRAEAQYKHFRETVDYLLRDIQLPEVRFPAPYEKDPLLLTSDDIEQLAEDTRRFWGLGDGPIANMVRLLEHHGAAVGRGEMGTVTLDAFSQWGMPDDRPFFMFGTEKPSAVRARMNAAHELAHMVLHRTLADEVVKQPSVLEILEDQANRFAGAFLLPATTFSRAVFVPTLNGLRMQKATWKVSIGAMIMRLTQLHLINEAQTTRLWQSYSRMGWRKVEPDDDKIEAEQPLLFRRALELLFAERSADQMMADLTLKQEDIQSSMSLPFGIWRDRGPEIRFIRRTGSPQPEATVLPMRRPRTS